jgi:hypothetical protein
MAVFGRGGSASDHRAVAQGIRPVIEAKTNRLPEARLWARRILLLTALVGPAMTSGCSGEQSPEALDGTEVTTTAAPPGVGARTGSSLPPLPPLGSAGTAPEVFNMTEALLAIDSWTRLSCGVLERGIGATPESEAATVYRLVTDYAAIGATTEDFELMDRAVVNHVNRHCPAEEADAFVDAYLAEL